MRISLVLAAGCSLALAACGGNSVDDPSNTKQIATAMEAMSKPQPGEYRTSSELVNLEMPGAREEEVQMIRSIMEMGTAQEMTFCITPEQASKGYREYLKEMQQSAENCSFSKFEVDGDQLDATLSCKEMEGAMGDIGMSGTIGETEQDMTITMDMKESMTGKEMKMVLSSKTTRIGDCAG